MTKTIKISIFLSLIMVSTTAYALTMAPPLDTLTSVVANGNNMAWVSRTKIFLSTSETFPKYTTYDLEPTLYGHYRLAWSGDGKVLYAIKTGALLRFNFEGGKLTLDSTYEKPDLCGFYLRTNKTGSRLIVSICGKDTKSYKPGWRSAVELVYKKKSFEIDSILTEQSEGKFLAKVFMDDYEKLYYANSAGHRCGYKCRYKMKNGNEIVDFYNCGDRSLLDIAPKGNRLLLSSRVDYLKDKAGNSLITLFVAEVSDGKVNEPLPVIIPHVDPILWHAQFADDGETIVWPDLVRGEDGNKIVRRKISMTNYVNEKWNKPKTLFEVPNTQIWDMAVSKSVIVMVNTKNQVIFFDRLAKGAKPQILDMKLDRNSTTTERQ